MSFLFYFYPRLFQVRTCILYVQVIMPLTAQPQLACDHVLVLGVFSSRTQISLYQSYEIRSFYAVSAGEKQVWRTLLNDARSRLLNKLKQHTQMQVTYQKLCKQKTIFHCLLMFLRQCKSRARETGKKYLRWDYIISIIYTLIDIAFHQ